MSGIAKKKKLFRKRAYFAHCRYLERVARYATYGTQPPPVVHDLKRELKRQELKAEATDFNCFQDLSPETLTDLLNAIEKADRELELKLASMSEEERLIRHRWYRKAAKKRRKQMIKYGHATWLIYPGDWPESPDDSLVEIKAEEGYIFPWDC